MAKKNKGESLGEGLDNLVVLMFAGNNCYTQVVKLGAEGTEGLGIDPGKKTWSYFISQDYKWNDIRIGTERGGLCRSGYKSGVIGVYDMTKLEHLNSMVHHACEATRPESGPFDEDF